MKKKHWPWTCLCWSPQMLGDKKYEQPWPLLGGAGHRGGQCHHIWHLRRLGWRHRHHSLSWERCRWLSPPWGARLLSLQRAQESASVTSWGNCTCSQGVESGNWALHSLRAVMDRHREISRSRGPCKAYSNGGLSGRCRGQRGGHTADRHTRTAFPSQL